MIINKEIVTKKIRSFTEVQDFIDDDDYELFYSEYEKLVKKEFYKLDDGYIPVETLSFLIKNFYYTLEICATLDEFLEEMDYTLFDDCILK